MFVRWLRPHRVCLLCQCCFDDVGDDVLCSGCLKDFEALYARPSQQIHTPNALWQREWCSANYQVPLPQALQQWKHHGNSAFMPLFAQIMRHNPPNWLPHQRIDAVLPMPISRERRAVRGFNQCEELAHALAASYHWTILPSNAVFRQHKVAQSMLNRKQRLANIKNSFTVQHNVRGLHILLLDDICTTGATLNELAKALHEAGAASVSMWVVARKLVGS